ncbi:MAG: beta-galactosidase, partial [Candidatus Cloacimonetes bacterium]|nr:beta-galactosidase [Candidatus Cloacimonadota bacterium]
MSIIGKLGRHNPKTITLGWVIQLVLFLGALTMVYPFLLMISSSLKSAVDSSSLALIPKYLYDDEELYKKYLESRYNEESARLMDNYPGSWISFREVSLPRRPDKLLYRHWQGFIGENSSRYGVYHFYVAEHYGRGVYPFAQRMYRQILRQENDNDVTKFNLRYNTGAINWEEIVVEEKEIFQRNFVSSLDGYLGRFREFKLASPQWMRFYVNPDGAFVNLALIPAYGGDLQALNRDLGTRYSSWSEIVLPASCPPETSPLREHWLYYAREILNVHHLGIQPEAEATFRENLRAKYGSISLLNTTWQTDFESFEMIHIPFRLPDSGALVEDLSWFVQNIAAPEQIRIRSIARDFREYLKRMYPDIKLFNRAHKTSYASFEMIPFPAQELDYYPFLMRKAAIRKEFIWRNYAMALDQMLSDARSLRNTGIYVLLSIFFAVTVNPLAAYALSRFKPRFSYQVIMLFMLTMAFPAMVMGIPNFLMLKRLNLLNTFWALVLPAA